MFFVGLCVITIFVVLLAVGFSFYDDNFQPAVLKVHKDPTLAVLDQGTVLIVSTLFIASALLFVAASIKFLGTRH